MKQVLCEIGGNTYGIDIERVQGIEKKLDIVPVPNASNLIEGIANLRGAVIPVFSLYGKFHVEPKPLSEETKYIVVKVDDLLMSFRVDMVSEIVEVSEKDFLPVPTIVSNEDTKCMQSVINVNKNLVLVIDVESILNDVEKGKVSKMVAEFSK